MTKTLSSLLLFGLLGCIDPDLDPELAVDESEILNGDEISPSNTGLPMVANGNGICTGQLLDNEWVLTAAHCVDSYNDHMFDGDGQTMVLFPGYKWQGAKALAVDTYGRAVVAGNVWDGTTSYIGVTRVRSNGSPDPYFASGAGRVTAAFPGYTQIGVNDVAIDSHQRIVVVGYAKASYGKILLIARFTPTGQLDTTFAGDGRLLHNVGESLHEEAASVAIDASGRIVVGGTALVSSRSKWVVTRYTASGGIDLTWGDNGSVITEIYTTEHEWLEEIAVDNYGRVVAAGSADDYMAIARWTTSGALDTTLDGVGKVIVKYDGTYTSGRALAIDSQNRIVVTGETSSAASRGMLVARFTAAGALDASFDGNGWTSITPTLGPYVAGTGEGVAIDTKNRIVIAGTMRDDNWINAYAVGRLLSNGAKDGTFNTVRGAIADVAYDTVNDLAYEALGNDVAIDPSGNVFLSFALDGLSSDTGAFGVVHLLSEHQNVAAWPGLRIEMGSQNVATSRVFRFGAYDAALIKLASPLMMNGSTSGYEFRGFYTGAPSKLVGRTLRCYGYGFDTLSSGAGTLRTANLEVTSATAYEYALARNGRMQQLYRGDSGGPCYVLTSYGSLHSVAGITSWGNSLVSNQLAASKFADWANAVRAWY